MVVILSKSFDFRDGRGRSQVSLLAPALVQTITPSLSPKRNDGRTAPDDLAQPILGLLRREAGQSGLAP